MSFNITTQCLYEKGKKLRLARHPQGWMGFTLEPGSGAVLTLDVEKTKPFSSEHHAQELVVELVEAPPLGKALDIEKWARVALYKFGSSQLQFESMKATGTLQLTSISADGICHGQVDMRFLEPTIDITRGGQAHLELSF